MPMTDRVPNPPEQATDRGHVQPRDWTRDEHGRSNSSAEFRRLAGDVGHLIRSSAHDLIAGRADVVAVRIMAQLAHKHGMAPASELGRYQDTIEEIKRDGHHQGPAVDCLTCQAVAALEQGTDREERP
jgi:hypothetical protein